MAFSNSFLLLDIFGTQEMLLFGMILFAGALSYFTYKYGKSQGRTQEIRRITKEAGIYGEEKIF